MTSIKSRAVTGSRSSPRAAKSAASGLIRAGLLGSTALVAVGLAATGAMAQTYTPTGGGTIVVTGGGTTTDNTGASGGFQNVGGVGMTISGVDITNTSGAPTTSAISFTRSASSGSGDGFTFNGTNTLVAAAGGNGFNFSSTGGNNTGFSINGPLIVTGLNGVVVSTLGDIYHSGAGTLNLIAQTPGSGSGLLWTAGRSLGDSSLSGAFSATNFQYGANLTASNGYVYFTTGTGGAITGVNTGIRTTATAGSDVAIRSTINASAFGIQTSSGIGGNVITSNGAIVSGGIGIDATSGSATGNTVTANANITANGGPAIRTDGVFATGVASGVTVSGTTMGVQALTAGSSVTNFGTITAVSAGGDAINFSDGGTINNVGGSIAGADQGILSSAGTLIVTNAGSITGGTNDGITSLGALALTNTGTLSSTSFSGVALVGGGSVTNSGTITGGNNATYGYGVQNASASGTTLITNQSGGLINGGTGSILLNGAGNTTIDLQAGSTTTGQILAQGGGTRNITVAGTLNGNYAGTAGTGTTTFTLATGGAMQSANFGTGTTTFNWTGGTIAGGVTTTDGSYQNLNVNLGAGGTGTIGGVSRFFLNANSGTVTLTGSNVTSLKLLGGNIVLDTDLDTGGSTTASFQTTAGSTLTVNAGRSLISSTTGVNLSVAGTVTNAGTITGGQTNGVNSNFYFYGVNNQAAGTVINNSGTIAVGEYNLVAAIQNSNNLQVNNTGLIRAGAVSSTLTTDGIRSYSGTLTVANSTAGSIIAGGEAGILTTAGTLALTNAGYVVGTTRAINAAGTVSITNSGTIGTGQVNDMGVYTAGGTGYAISTNGGTITNSGTIRGASAGIYSSNGLTLTNTGTITGDAIPQSGLARDGVTVLNAPSTILNAGTISVPVYSALLIQGGTITNAAAGSLTGGSDSTYGVAVQFSATGGTFTNYGSATGAGAGAVRVNTPGAATTINLHAGSTTGALLLNSGNDTVAIYNGRGSASGATIDGASGITLQAAGTLAAASFGAINMGAGTNTLVLAGIGDGTAANGTAGTMANGTVGGVSNLSKIDSGLWTLTGAGSYAGTTTVSGGTLRVLNIGNGLGNGAVSIASGATLNFDNQTGGLMSVKGDAFTGAGRILFTGNAGSITALGNGGNGNVQISLAQGGLIDVQSGTVNGSSSGQGFWTSNMGSLNIASGARLDAVEGLVRVDALTGAGTLSGGFGGTVPVTIGVAGGSGTFSGVIRDSTEFAGRYLALTKVGAGTQTLSGTNTYTGQTSIQAGTLEVRGGSAILDTGVVSVSSGATFLVSNAETIGRLTGAGAVNLANGALTLSNSSGTYSGAMSGTGGLVLSAGSLTLGGALTNGGGLVLNGTTTANLLSAGSITVAGNAVTMNGMSNSFTNSGSVSSSGGIGVTASGSLTLTNAGSIDAASGTGLDLSGATNVVSNQSGATINGTHGINLGAGATGTLVTNNGTITGATQAILAGASTGIAVVNSGVTHGEDNALVAFGGPVSVMNLAGGQMTSARFSAIFSSGAATSVTNAGLISSSFGVFLTGGGGSITNQSGGVISGTGPAIILQGAGYSLDLQAGSTVNGVVDASGSTGLNTVTLAGDLNGGYTGGSGADNVTLFGGMTVSGQITGGSGVDALILGGMSDGSLDIGQTLGFESRTLTGGGIWTLSGADSDAADWTLDSGTLRLTGIQSINRGAGVLVNAGATLSVGDTNAMGALNGTGAVTIDSGQILIAGFNDADSVFSGVISGAGSLSQSGAGVMTLSGTNTFTGDARVDAGTLRLGASNVIADTARLFVYSGATLDIQGFNETVGLVSLEGTLNGTGTLSAADYYLYGATANANLGAGSLFNVGGVSILNGTSAAGTVAVQAGTLRLGESGRLADSASLSVFSNTTLDLQGFDETVATVFLNGTLTGAGTPFSPLVNGDSKSPELVAWNPPPVGTGTLTAAEYYLDGATVLANLGTGKLFNTGGISTLYGTVAAGQVSVQAGTLRLGQSDRLADTATVSVLSGATLDLTGNDETVALALLNGTLNSTTNILMPRADDAQVILALTVSTKGTDGPLTLPAPTGTGTLTAAEYYLNGATINANLGAGTLFNLGGTSVLTGTSAASQVNVNAGTLRLGASNRLADTATVSVSSGATFDVNSRTDTIGSLYGAGAVAISSGRLTFGGADSAFGGTLSGAGSLVHTGGLFTLGGSHTLQTISNTGGELRFLATTTGNVAVSGGSLTGAGTIGGALTVSGGATLSPGLVGQANGIGTFSGGSLTLNGGTLAADFQGLSGGNLSDRLVVSGTANLTGGTLAPSFGSPASGYDLLTRYQFLTAGQLVGTFSNGSAFTATSTQSNLFWRVRYDLTPNAAVLELRKLASFDLGTGGSGNQNAVGRALTIGQLQASDDWTSVLNMLSGLSGPQRQAAFDSLGGEALADMSSSLFSANDTFMEAVRNAGATRAPGSAPLSFASAFSFVGGRDGAAAMVTGVLDAFDPSAEAGTGRGGWISVHASDVDLEGKAGQADLQTRLNGFVGGYAVGTGAYVFGAAAGATRVEGDVSGRQSSFESDLVHAAGYMRFDDGRWASDVTASVYSGEIDSQRTVTAGAFSGQALGRTHGGGQSLSVSIARRFANDSGGTVSIGLMETMSRSTVDAFTERAAGGLSLEVAEQERNWETTQLNLRGTQDYQLSGQPLRLYGGVGVLITTGDREARSDMRFSGAATGFGGFTVEGAQAAPLAGVTEFGLEYQPREGLTLSTGYRAVFSERLNDNQVGARMSIEW
ncbi:autotransporter-associated beta strand repeat-containing protein [uncultured Brevundimonas sp.]|uniref:beta strand repeat-containing protein n=1 Tax=uncultured Brevundimonas sp. TaxID=213418 RepID=UPI0030EEA5BB|tara:strand:- start:121815 stop:130106 length:8292 start_codon:yes stop_codon:yes gene_type:complete